MPKVLGKIGVSLADVYDIEGSVAGVETLEVRDIHGFHEMGGTGFSERLSGQILEQFFDGILQTVTLGASFSGLPESPFRLAGVQVFTDDSTPRIADLNVSLRQVDASGGAQREMPIWNWDQSNLLATRILVDGTPLNLFMLRPEPFPIIPNLLIGSLNRGVVNDIAIRGHTTTFGAGTVDIRILIYVMHPDSTGKSVSSVGLPIPSW